MKERSCVHPFIKRVQYGFSSGGTLREGFAEIAPYQARVAKVYDVNVYWPHAIAVSSFGLGAFVIYEAIRSKTRLPLPDSRKVIDTIVPYKARSEQFLLNQPINDPRHQQLAGEMESTKTA